MNKRQRESAIREIANIWRCLHYSGCDNKLLNELQMKKLKQAKELVREVWLELSPVEAEKS
jgi:hypothetical protein